MKDKKGMKIYKPILKKVEIWFQERITKKEDIDEGRVGLRNRNELTCDFKSLRAMLG